MLGLADFVKYAAKFGLMMAARGGKDQGKSRNFSQGSFMTVIYTNHARKVVFLPLIQRCK